MPLPILAGLAAAKLGSKLLGGFFKGKAEKKKAEADTEAAEELYGARSAEHDALQGRRSSRLDAIQGALGSVGGALPEGAPDYSFDPAVLAKLQEATPYGETAGSLMGEATGDPAAGIGSNMLAGFAGGVGDAAGSAILGSAGGSEAPMTMPESGSEALGHGGITPEQWDAILAKKRGE